MLKIFAPMLAVAFIVMKLLDMRPVADWSWWWVTSPLWLSCLIVFVWVFTALLIKELRAR